MAITRVRNRGPTPFIGSEGELVKPFPKVGKAAIGTAWSEGLSCFDRLYGCQTLCSARRYAHFHAFPNLIPKDVLDFRLQSAYNPDEELFSDKVDVVLQKETLNIDTWRRLRNTRDIKPERDAISAAAAVACHGKPIAYKKYNESHPVFIGGIKERRHPSNIKLMNSGHHSPQTNAGYSRHDSDGSAYYY
ncbi:protein CFAP276 [Onthophagus taurus]|uniref:protein CFAP276 n=1 Tax=Onthophagus taurus TaxID=166361 RepID=UPI000C1FE0A0|nr:uncharacterized protein C1orf194 homolog [Onthophagus taurus]XP_022916245.1 uncharacterized protein C1orf194 homolog [Onthophagus taurus]